MTSNKLALLLALIVIAYLAIYVLPINLQGDGFRHASWAKEIASSGELLENTPYQLNEVENGVRVNYFPFPYPQTGHVLYSLMSMVGGDTLLKLASPLMGAVAAVVIFLLLKDVNRYIAFFAALGALILNSRRFIMTPLLEQPLLLAAALALFCYYSFFKTGKLRYVVLAGIFLGLAMIVKQQGYLLFGMVLLHAVLFFGYKAYKYRGVSQLRPIAVILVFAVLVSFAPLADLVQRTGTVAFSPGTTTISEWLPFHSTIEDLLSSNIPVNEEAEEALAAQLGYELEEVTVFDTAEQYLLFPVFFGSQAESGFVGSTGKYLLVILFGVLFVLGCGYLARKDGKLLSLLLLVFVGEWFAATILGHYVYQYYVISLSILAIVVASGTLVTLTALIRRGRTGRYMSIALILFLVISSAIGYGFVIAPECGDEGRQTDYYLGAYRDLGEYARENTPEDAIFLNSSVNFSCFSERDHIWLDFGGGAKIPLIFETSDPEVALQWLEYYGIDYIVIDMGQTGRKGLYDYIPPHGLLDYIDTSPNFERVYQNEDGVLRLYSVTYEV